MASCYTTVKLGKKWYKYYMVGVDLDLFRGPG
jgi:hypothetical protein